MTPFLPRAMHTARVRPLLRRGVGIHAVNLDSFEPYRF